MMNYFFTQAPELESDHEPEGYSYYTLEIQGEELEVFSSKVTALEAYRIAVIQGKKATVSKIS